MTTQPTDSEATGSENTPEAASQSPAGESDPEPEPSRPGDGDDDRHRPAVELIFQAEDTDPPTGRWIDPMMRRVMTEAGCPDAAVTLVLVDDRQMAHLHEQYTGVSGTTDVLTFDHRDRADGPVEGDIVLCVDEARRQAAKRGHDARVELLLYAVHGLLHLLGEDDHDEAAYQRMHAREDRLLEAVGVGAVFDRGRRGASPMAGDPEGTG